MPVMTTVTPASSRPAAADGSKPGVSSWTPAARHFVHDRPVPVDGEPLHHRVGDRRANAVHDREGVRRGGRDRVERAEGVGQGPGRGRPHVPDGQRDQDPPQRPGLRLVQVGEQRVRDELEAARLVDEERAGRQLLVGQVEQVALVGHQAVVEQGDDRLVAERLDVERAARGEVEQPLAELRRAGHGVGAAPVDLALVPAQRRAALRALRGGTGTPARRRCAGRRPARRPRG